MSTFHSTRSSDEAFTSKQAIRKGIADDGGLFVTDALGETKIDISDLAGKSYQQIALTVLSVLLDDYTEEELSQCIAEAYGSQSVSYTHLDVYKRQGMCRLHRTFEVGGHNELVPRWVWEHI